MLIFGKIIYQHDGIPVVDVAPSWLEVQQKQPVQPVETAKAA